MRKGIIFLLSICFFTCVFSQNKTVSWECKQLSHKELNNISILSECYGYVRFFYPNPHIIENFDWIKFLMYAIPEIEQINTDDELKNSLLKLFKPICPQISFSTDSIASTEKLPPPYFVVEHKAIGTLAKMAYGKKYSPIVEIADNEEYKHVYSYKLKENLYINFPLAVKELPAKTKEFVRFKKEIDKIDVGGISLFTALFNKKKAANSSFIWYQSAYRIADIIVRRNYVQHFYPYFAEDELSKNWDQECMKAVEKIAKTNEMHEYYAEICKLLANVKDSHIRVYPSFRVGKLAASYIRTYYPDISLSIINDTCIVDSVGNDYKNHIKQGDIVCSINNSPIEEVINQILLKTPFSTKSNGFDIMSSGGKLFESSQKDSVFDITIKSHDNIEKNIQIKTELSEEVYHWNNDFIQIMDDNIAYINLCSYACTYDNFVKKLPVIQNCKGIIFDIRGYPSFDVLSIISHFIKEKIEIGNLSTPIIRYPNQENIKYEMVEKWGVQPATSPQSEEASKKYEYKLPQPVQVEIPVVFLIDGKTLSFGETFAEMMKFYNIGTLVGTHTAGCNGDMTVFYGTYSYWFSMTYNKFLNRDGSQHHGIGVLPDLNCEMQVSDIRNNIDTQLEKAKELLR